MSLGLAYLETYGPLLARPYPWHPNLYVYVELLEYRSEGESGTRYVFSGQVVTAAFNPWPSLNFWTPCQFCHEYRGREASAGRIL